MPQLKPLMWVMSIFMVLLILFMLIDMYFYKGKFIFDFQLNSRDVDNLTFLW